MVLVAVLGKVAVDVVDRHLLVRLRATPGEFRQPRVGPLQETPAGDGVVMPDCGAIVPALGWPRACSEQLLERLAGDVAAVRLTIALEAALR